MRSANVWDMTAGGTGDSCGRASYGQQVSSELRCKISASVDGKSPNLQLGHNLTNVCAHQSYNQAPTELNTHIV
jgi:hypothetical protein